MIGLGARRLLRIGHLTVLAKLRRDGAEAPIMSLKAGSLRSGLNRVDSMLSETFLRPLPRLFWRVGPSVGCRPANVLLRAKFRHQSSGLTIKGEA
jgi:hypothetical protein